MTEPAQQNQYTIALQANQRYSLCTCGHSRKLPFCDDTHREINAAQGTTYKSLKILVKEDIELEVCSKNWGNNRENRKA